MMVSLTLPLLVSASFLLTLCGAAAIPTPSCPILEAVFLRGTYEQGLGIVGTPLASSLASRLPGSSIYSVPYSSDPEYFATVTQGAQMVSAYMTTRAASCPKTQFALVGYSKGAMVIHQTKLSAALQAKVSAVVVFGDPVSLSGVSGVPLKSSSTFKSFCNQGDPFCDHGFNIMAHLAYGKDGSTDKAAAFIAGTYIAI